MRQSRLYRFYLVLLLVSVFALVPRSDAQPPSPPPPVTAAKASDGDTTITLNLNNVPIEQLVKFLSDTTGKPVIKQKDINTQISVMSPVPISRKRALELIYDALQVENIFVVDMGDKLQIVSAAAIKGMALQNFGENDDIQSQPDSIRIVRKVYRLKNTTTDNVKVHLDKFIPDAAITIDPKTNTIILTDQITRLKIYDRIVQTLDAVNTNERVVEVFHLQFADSIELAILIGNVMTNSSLFVDAASSDAKSRSLSRGLDAFQAYASQSRAARGVGAISAPLMIGDVTLVPDPRSNSLIISCPKNRLPELSGWIKDFDKEQKLDVQVRVIDIHFVEARSISQSISDLFRDQTGTSAKDIVRAIPTDQGNSIFILSSQKNFDLIQNLVKEFDTADAAKQETRTYPVMNLEAKDLADQLGLLYGTSTRSSYYYASSTTTGQAKFVASPRTNSLMVLAVPREFTLIEKLIKELDVVVDREKFQPRIYRIHNTDASELLTVLTSLFEKPTSTSGRSSSDDSFWRPSSQSDKDALEALYGKIHFVVDNVTNTIIALASNPKNYEFIDKLIGDLDRIDPESAEVLVVDLKYAKAIDIADQVNTLLSNGAVQRPTAPQPTPTAASSTSGTATSNATTPAPQPSYQVSNQTSAPIVYPWQSASQQQSNTKTPQQPINRMIGNVRAVPDLRSNKIILTAQPMYFPALRQLIATLDHQEPQVHITTKMVEVSWGKERRLGIRWTPDPRTIDPSELDNAILGIGRLGFLGGYGHNNGGVTNVKSNSNLATDIGGVSREISSTIPGGNTLLGSEVNIALLVQLLLKNTNSRIVSQPELTVNNNEMGNIFVGSEFPFRTNSQTTDVGTVTFGIEYRKVGINVDITPHINTQGEIVLRILLENSKIRPGETVDGQIIKDERSFQTELAVESAQTAVIGGIILQDEASTERRVPILGRIPVVSWAFKKRDATKSIQELLVFITPEVLQNREDSDQLLKASEARLQRFDLLREGKTPAPSVGDPHPQNEMPPPPPVVQDEKLPES